MDNPTALEAALALLVQTFSDYAGGYEEGNTIKKKDFKRLITEQMPHIDELGPKCPAEEMLEGLDIDGDGELNFQEFCIFASTLAIIVKKLMSGELSK